MTINIQFVKMPASEALMGRTEKRLQKLSKKYDWIIKAEVFFKLGKDVVNNNICEIELSLPGPKIFAASKEKTFEMALKETLLDVGRQLKKRKETVYNH